MKVAIDFDGTCVTHEFPNIGHDIGAVPVLKKLQEAGHQLILFTMRSGKELLEAVEWFSGHGISLYGVNWDPTQNEWTDSPKAYANLYIDDAALGCPLMFPTNKYPVVTENPSTRPFVDWSKVEEMLSLWFSTYGVNPNTELVL